MSVICHPDQLHKVYYRLHSKSYTTVDPTPYVMDCSLEASTLSDRRASDRWALHPILAQQQREEVPTSTPFALIVTGRRADNKPHSDRPLHSLHAEREASNPAPDFCTRDKFHFDINLSRYWQESTDAPMCKEYPYSYGFANFLWWHTRPEDIVVTISNEFLLPLVASYMSVHTIGLAPSKAAASRLDKGLRSLYFQRTPEQKR